MIRFIRCFILLASFCNAVVPCFRQTMVYGLHTLITGIGWCVDFPAFRSCYDVLKDGLFCPSNHMIVSSSCSDGKGQWLHQNDLNSFCKMNMPLKANLPKYKYPATATETYLFSFFLSVGMLQRAAWQQQAERGSC